MFLVGTTVLMTSHHMMHSMDQSYHYNHVLSCPAKHGDRTQLLLFQSWLISHTTVTRKSAWQVAATATSAIESTASVTKVEQWADLPFDLRVWCLSQERPGA